MESRWRLDGGFGADRASSVFRGTAGRAAKTVLECERCRPDVFREDFNQVHLGWGKQNMIARCARWKPLPTEAGSLNTVEPEEGSGLGA